MLYDLNTDLAALPGVLGLELKRYYNSLSSHSGIAGPQWRLSYETVLYDLGSQIQILQADGRRLSFAKSLAKGAGSGLCTSPQLADGQVRIEQGSDGKPVYHWRWADGRTLTFMGGTAGGFPLHRISAPTGEQLQLRYNPLGDLVAVTDPQGRSLSFLYGRAGPGQRAPLESVDTPLGRIRYAHDKLGRLTEAAFLPLNGSALGKATLTRLYHYEEAHQAGNSFALTGISLRAPGAQDQRLSTYAYETSGAAILTTRGRPQARDDKGQVLPGTGIEQLQVRYEARPLPQEGAPDRSGEVQPRSFGRIVLTNALGQATVLRSAVIAGQLRLIDSRGAGCSTCGPANVSYGYDREGRLIRSTQLSAEGTPLRAELRRYDAWGRLAETSIQAYEKGKPQAPQWTQRLAYRDQR
ncbi:MAG TPA: DUF6531 domain-containing protein, partial [Burkholderiaceae bacterium]|nr:DUF6531 domain-containing protein [Burkholderiaceae bacterium]